MNTENETLSQEKVPEIQKDEWTSEVTAKSVPRKKRSGKPDWCNPHSSLRKKIDAAFFSGVAS